MCMIQCLSMFKIFCLSSGKLLVFLFSFHNDGHMQVQLMIVPITVAPKSVIAQIWIHVSLNFKMSFPDRHTSSSPLRG